VKVNVEEWRAEKEEEVEEKIEEKKDEEREENSRRKQLSHHLFLLL
jgi:hypothetical protein